MKGARSQRLDEVLGQTESCLKALASKLGLKLGPIATQCSGTSAAGDADARPSTCPWAALAERLIADVPQQPKLLEGPAPLREYQMHVSLDTNIRICDGSG